MNKIRITSNETELPVLEWRRRNVEFLQREYIPYMLNKLNTNKSEISDIMISELSGQYSTEGFKYNNIKLLEFTLKTNRGEFPIKIKLPIPSDDDIYVLNRKHYIMVNILNDDIYYIFNKTIYSVTFRISEEGMWYQYKGSQSKSTNGIPLVQVLQSLEILGDWLPNFRFTSDDESDNKTKRSAPISKEGYLTYDIAPEQYNNFKDAYDLIERSIINLKNEADLNKNIDKVLDKVNNQNPFDYSLMYGFIRGHEELPQLYNEILMSYKSENFIPNEIHIKFKRVAYYETVLKPLENRIKSIANLFSRAKNVDISWHQKIPNNLITKALRSDKNISKYLQYLEFHNIFNEDLKHKVVIPLNNVPKYLRNTSHSAKEYFAIDPINTPDSKQIGIVQHLTYMTKLDDYGYFLKP